MLLVLVWLGIAAAVTAWALRARRAHLLDLSADVDLTDVAAVDVTESTVDELDWRRLR